jgi:hypothetical protein
MFNEENVVEKKQYKAPKLVSYGPIADHTFNNPGVGDKSSTPMETDKFGEFSHPGTTTFS